ncbi:MAG TPA: tRNA 4-thiouridine(8) synthase ThiI, partial [Candidatus Pelethenecus faecipullorum]|nr:tRNA 4-thiouridine(8) synthase ThiI [Candidatus Pelethenecus faecipullorum]
MYDQILVRFGDLTLKGKNQKEFLHRLYALVDRKMADLKVKIEKTYDRIYIHLNGEAVDTVLKRLDYVSGISSYSLVAKCDNELETIKKTALDLMKELVQEETSFKVETKRANKQYPLTSLAISKEVSAYVLSKHKFLKVDVHHPKLTLHLEVKGDFCYLYNQEIKALGGYPVGVAGKGMLLLSGG